MGVLENLVSTGKMAADWAHALKDTEPVLLQLRKFLLEEEKQKNVYLPHHDNIFKAFETPMTGVKVLLLGQDPYPTRGHAMGLSFSVDKTVRPLPRSLTNIYKELESDIGIAAAEHGDLSSWSRQGVMLLNRVLTVAEGSPDSHAGRGWETFTETAVQKLVAANPDLVSILWGAKARSMKPILKDTRVVESPHPSPLSARRGFFGSKPFSKTNSFLRQSGKQIIDWSV